MITLVKNMGSVTTTARTERIPTTSKIFLQVAQLRIFPQQFESYLGSTKGGHANDHIIHSEEKSNHSGGFEHQIIDCPDITFPTLPI